MKFLKGRRVGRVRALAIPLVAIVAALAITACGGSSSGSGTTSKSASAATGGGSTTSTSGGGTSTTAKGGAPSSGQRAKLQACLKKHGVTLPSRPAGGYGGGHYGGGAPGGGAPPAGGNPGTGTTHTFTRPPGGFGGGGPGGFAGGNSKFAKAIKACGGFGAGGFGGGRFRGGAGGNGRAPQFSATVLKKFVACVRKNGYPQMPEASSSSNSNGGLFPKDIEGNPNFQKASQSCESVLRSAFPRRPRGTG